MLLDGSMPLEERRIKERRITGFVAARSRAKIPEVGPAEARNSNQVSMQEE